MLAYQDLIKRILRNGHVIEGRNGEVLSIFGDMLTFDVSKYFPAVTIKPLYFKTMVKETLWFIEGKESTEFLDKNGVKIWEKWTHPEKRSVGPMYGVQLRNRLCIGNRKAAKLDFENGRCQGYGDVGGKAVWKIDPLKDAIEMLKTKPYSRRNVITLWDPSTVAYDELTPIENIENGRGALALCHGTVIQFHAHKADGEFHLSMNMYQRSCDVLVGLPFNIAQYALLLNMVAYLVNMKPSELKIFLGDAHIYMNQMHVVEKLLDRKPKGVCELVVNKNNRVIDSIDSFVVDDFELVGYESRPAIEIPVTE